MEAEPFSATLTISTLYAVFKVTYTSESRDHKAIFIADGGEKAGHLYHVVSSNQQGIDEP